MKIPIVVRAHDAWRGPAFKTNVKTVRNVPVRQRVVQERSCAQAVCGERVTPNRRPRSVGPASMKIVTNKSMRDVEVVKMVKSEHA